MWTETVMMEKGPQFKSELDRYNKNRMIIQLDQSYEHDVPHYADNENYQWIRRKMYDGLLSGCAGTSFSPGTIDNQCYSFNKWQPLMNTAGMQQAKICFNLFEKTDWQKLVPDQGKDIIVNGRGEVGDINYICAALMDDKSGYVMYIPNGRTFYLNTKKISDKPLKVKWYNPRTGEIIKIGTVGSWDKFGFATPSDEDWVLVMQVSM